MTQALGPLQLLLAVALLSACSLRTPPPPGASGDVIYRLQNCANCHGDEGEGTRRGPALFGAALILGQHWTRDTLAEYLADPAPVVERDARLAAMNERFPGRMQRYDNLDLEQRRVLAAWLLAR